MNISLNWLKYYVDIDVPVQELCDKMVMAGFEVESIVDLSQTMKNVVAGKIVKIEKHPDAEIFCFSTKSPRSYTDIAYPDGAYLFFGPETRGLPEDFLRENYERCVRIPMRGGLRSLNLSNSVAVAVYEVFRQRGFSGLEAESNYLE